MCGRGQRVAVVDRAFVRHRIKGEAGHGQCAVSARDGLRSIGSWPRQGDGDATHCDGIQGAVGREVNDAGYDVRAIARLAADGG